MDLVQENELIKWGFQIHIHVWLWHVCLFIKYCFLQKGSQGPSAARAPPSITDACTDTSLAGSKFVFLHLRISVFLYFVPYGSMWQVWFHQISSSANSFFRVATELWWRENFNAGRSHWGWPQGTFVYLKLINITNQVLNNDCKIILLTLVTLGLATRYICLS